MKQSLQLAAIKKRDKSDMLGLLLDFPLQCKAAMDIAKNVSLNIPPARFNKVVCAGLGGSAIGADLVRAYLYADAQLPIAVVREYDLPAYVDPSTLVIISSYSGNTEETLSAYAQAKARGAVMIAITSGGIVKANALRDNVTFVEIPPGLPPRCSVGYLSLIPLILLSKLGITKDVRPAINEAISVMEKLRDTSLHPRIAQKDNIAKHIATRLVNKMPAVYTSSVHFDVVATRIKGQLNENSKSLAISHVLPEMNHNEIVGWAHPHKLFKDFVVLMLRDKGTHPRVTRRIEITEEIIRKEGVPVIEIWSHGEGLLSRMFSLVYTGDFISFYLACLYGIDPTPVERITFLKDQLKR
jgi:glucose/mannose-6-phosphate isomerase